MDVITMRSTRLTINKLRVDFPDFHFEKADEFLWSAVKKTIYVNPDTVNSPAFTLHELSHALLGHEGYRKDIELLKLERDAWLYAKNTLGPQYDVSIDDTTVQDNLDTYRQWLHDRSMCPACEAIGVQTRGAFYSCIACGQGWRVNEARLCALRRYSLQTK